MNKENPLNRVHLTHPVHFLALGLGSGLLRPAPGTWGSLAGLVVGYFCLTFLGLTYFTLFTFVAFVIGCYLCQKTADDMQVHDHGAIVWDEFVGIFITLIALPQLTWPWLALAFFSFRFFDILKPYPIRYFDQKLESGFGIMIDDVLAAVYAVLVIYGVRAFV